jgi:type II secretory ATPase GspE/PulE/Tfp pilus assembly ATPase PilB-like protein
MTRSIGSPQGPFLPANPNLEQLKKQAKDLLKAFKAGDPSVCHVLRYHYRFARASDETILKSEITLQEAQHALALDYGFKSWADLKAGVEGGPSNRSQTEEQRNEATTRAYSRAVELGDTEAILNLVTPDCVIHYDEETKPHDEVILDHMRGYEKRKGERHVIDDIIASGDKLSLRMTSYYTDRDGSETKQHYSAVHRFVDGRIAETWHDLRTVTKTGDAAPAEKDCLAGIMEEAVKSRASDIHLERREDQLLVRYRVDGVLQDIPDRVPVHLQAGIIRSLKQMCALDVEESAKPQNGRAYLTVAGRALAFRASIMPYVGGESAVIRILDRANVTLGLDQQALSPAHLAMIQSWKDRPNGLFLISGPTGSGKTTTMYSVLRELNPKERKIVTCEEPVEYVIEGINQQNVDPDNGLPLVRVLREVMRQDPDVIMIGEIRDRESLEAAMQLALTGHLVFSCMHTNDAAGGVRRLVDVASEPYLLNSCLIGVMAQRLVRKICPDCRTAYTPEAWMRDAFGGSDAIEYFKGAGCESCNGTGYRGRVPVQELLEMDDGLRSCVARSDTLDEMRAQAVHAGMVTMRDDGLAKVAQGITTIDEILRVTSAGVV